MTALGQSSTCILVGDRWVVEPWLLVTVTWLGKQDTVLTNLTAFTLQRLMLTALYREEDSAMTAYDMVCQKETATRLEAISRTE